MAVWPSILRIGVLSFKKSVCSLVCAARFLRELYSVLYYRMQGHTVLQVRRVRGTRGANGILKDFPPQKDLLHLFTL
jgi:hypothetical protein